MLKLVSSFAICLLIITNITAQKSTNIVDNNNKFAFELFSKISSTDTTNVFISPISISTALSMTYDGAKGRTAKEMRKTLGFTRSKEDSHKEFTKLLSHYRNNKVSFFTIVNAAFAQQKYNFLESYFDLLKDYNAVIKQADFMDDIKREQARNEINQWVMDNTNNKIEELLDKSAVDKMTRLILLNAIHFKADWKHAFPEDKTRQMIFHHPNRQYIAAFMHLRRNFKYHSDNNLTVLELPYKNDDASLFILLPSEKCHIDDFINNFDYSQFDELSKSLTDTKIDLLIPKFKIEAKYKLKKTLISLGMETAFTTKANFKNMTGRSDLMIDDVIHQSFIEIDEKGTEAAAATAVVVRQKSVPQVTYVNLNRPFVFIIKENYKNSILFIGKFMNP
ncbi:MAG: serpin family protein [Bacteroidales bacterium]|nr:serpin family protein [Bacteroidales bacterium]